MAMAVPFISLGVVGNTICNRSLSPESLCKCTNFPPEVLRASRSVFVPSSPEDADRRDDQDDAEQLTGLGSGSPLCAPSCREAFFSETRLPITVILGNPVSEKRASRKLR